MSRETPHIFLSLVAIGLRHAWSNPSRSRGRFDAYDVQTHRRSDGLHQCGSDVRFADATGCGITAGRSVEHDQRCACEGGLCTIRPRWAPRRRGPAVRADDGGSQRAEELLRHSNVRADDRAALERARLLPNRHRRDGVLQSRSASPGYATVSATPATATYGRDELLAKC